MRQIELDIFKFPEGFLWGAATSSHQVEGYNRFNDWWAWEQVGRTKDKSGRAADHYRLFRKDIRLAKELGHNSFRFSIEWSRIQPQKELWEEAALSHYKEVVEFCLGLNIKPIVTLNHFTLPGWFSDAGGWLDSGSVKHFERYVGKIANTFGGKVRFWITLNEPVVYIYKSFIEGTWPPGKKSFWAASVVFKNLLRASRLGYRIIHGIYADRNWRKPEVGIAKHLLAFYPCSSKSFLDRFSAFARNYCFNYLFVKRLVSGKSLDFIGVNYYRRDFIHHSGFSIFGDTCPDSHRHKTGEINYLGWETYPEGLREKLIEAGRFKLPLFITENGFCSESDGDRWYYIYSHLREISFAIKQGVDVIGYLYWSLIDNFEWADGFGPRFGLIEVDYETQERFVRKSAYRFAEVCRENKLRLEGQI